MSDAAVLHCPACGAPAAPGDTVCRYCEAPLATVACPKCFGLAFKGAKNCPHCGAQLVADAGVKTGQACPGCRKPMSLRELGGHPMEICGACAGVWIDRPTFEALCHDEEHQAIVVEELPAAPASVGAVVAQVGYRPCPACGALMNRVNFAQISGVLLDTCKSHGTFFDPDELRRLVAFLQDGGMDRARARQIEALKAQQQLAEGAQSHGTGAPSLSGGTGDFQFMNAADHVGGLQGGITRFLFDLFLK